MHSARLRSLNGHGQNRRGAYVLYWMTAARRASHSLALDHAVALCRESGTPLLVLEALRVGYPWASDRFHAFVMAGMEANARAFAAAGVTYLPYVEREPGAGRGLVEQLAKKAVAVVTDDYPCFFLPRMLAAVGPRLPVHAVAVDGNGLLPMRLTEQVFPTAVAFRRHLQRELAAHLGDMPSPRPLAGKGLDGAEPGKLSAWPMGVVDPASLPIDHTVGVVEDLEGGAAAGKKQLERFVGKRLGSYAERRSHPDDEVGSGLSPYLHFGHVGVHQVLRQVAAHEDDWQPDRLAPGASGRRDGFWRMSQNAEAFLDELVTWRELGFNFCAHRADADRYESLPEWARKSLDEHASDARTHLYPLSDLESAATHDEVWNAAQRELVASGRIHNYLRMLWGKKILEWSPTPKAALAVMIQLNNKYALDGRDPNSYTGIMWVLGRYDRPWAPTRAIFGCIRYMSSQNTVKKLDLESYLGRWSKPKAQLRLV